MKKILFILIILFPVFGSAQGGTKNSWEKSYPVNGVYESADTGPHHKGWSRELDEFFKANLKYKYIPYPNDKYECVYVKFIVETDSTVSNIEVLKAGNKVYADEVVRVVKLLKLVPAMEDGKNVRFRLIWSIGFDIPKTQIWDPDFNANDSIVFEIVDEMPKYPGGKDSFNWFIKKNAVFPENTHKALRYSTVYVKCIVEKDGSTGNVNVLKTEDENLNEEAVRLTKLMKFTPGMEMGKAVRTAISFPIVFTLPEDKRIDLFGEGIAMPESNREAEIFEFSEKMPEYPGGDAARQAFIAKHFQYPVIAKKDKKQGTIILQFVVETDGSLSDVKAVKKFDEACAAEAVRIAKLMKWNPGEQRGKKVRVKISMPVKFKLD